MKLGKMKQPNLSVTDTYSFWKSIRYKDVFAI